MVTSSRDYRAVRIGRAAAPNADSVLSGVGLAERVECQNQCRHAARVFSCPSMTNTDVTGPPETPPWTFGHPLRRGQGPLRASQ